MPGFLTSMIDLMVVAIAVALLAHRMKLPYTAGLVIAGIALALSPVRPDLTLTHDIIFEVILPPLLFEAAINIQWRELRKDSLPIITLAIPGTMIAAAFISGGCYYVLHWPWQPCLMFGVLIAATDPVAVIAMFKDNGVHGRVRLLVESESLLNDAAAAILFALALAWVQAPGTALPGTGQAVRLLTLTLGGGIAIGALCAGSAMALIRGTQDHLLESAVTTILAYGSFLLAERLGGSGVLAAVTAGLVVGNTGLAPSGSYGSVITGRGREFTLALWDFIAFIANSFVFLLIGIAVAGISFHELGDKALAIVIALSLAGRALTVYPLCALFRPTRWAIPSALQHVLWWGGLRGALGLALALSLPPDLPMRNQVLIATFGTVIFSVGAQGLSMPLLLRHLGITGRR